MPATSKPMQNLFQAAAACKKGKKKFCKGKAKQIAKRMPLKKIVKFVTLNKT